MFETKKATKAEILFRHTPVWKALLKVGIPSVIIAFMNGLYTFIDQIMQVNIIPSDGVHTNENVFGQYNGGSLYDQAAALINQLKESPGTATAAASLQIYDVTDIVRMANALVAPLLMVIIAISLLFGMGTAVHYSLAIGRKESNKASQIWSAGLQSTLTFTFVITIMMIFIGPIWVHGQAYAGLSSSINLDGFDLSKSQQDLLNSYYSTYTATAVTYASYIIRIVASGTMFLGFVQVGSNLINSEGRQVNVMFAAIVANVCNIVLDYVLMEYAKQGVVGAASATVMAYVINAFAILLIIVWLNRTATTHLTLNAFKTLNFNLLIIGGVILIGLPSFLRNFSNSISSSLQQTFLVELTHDLEPAKGNNYYQTLNGAILPIYNVVFTATIGIVRGSRMIMSYNVGAKQYNRIKTTFWVTTLYTAIYGIVIYFVIGFGLAVPLLNIFDIKAGDQMQDAHFFLMMTMLQIPLFALQSASMTIFQAAGKVTPSILVSGAQGIWIGLPMLYIMRDISMQSNNIQIFLAANAINSLITGIIVFSFSSWYVVKKVGPGMHYSKLNNWLMANITKKAAVKNAKWY